MKTTILILIGVAILAFFGKTAFEWTFCRVYIKPGSMGIITAKEGKPLEANQILAKPGQKGVLEAPLGVGRHFLNPYTYDIEVVPLQPNIPPGKMGIVTSKVGEDLPNGEFLATPGQKGIWKTPLGPGLYALNPQGYDVTIIDAISIPIGYVGVVTSLSGTLTTKNEFATNGEKGVMENILQPGIYYLNPKAYRVDVIEIGVNQVTLSGKQGGTVITKSRIETGNQAVEAMQSRVLEAQAANRSEYLVQSKDMTAGSKTAPQPKTSTNAQVAGPGGAVSEFLLNQHVGFPSRDGFDISLDMTVEFELLPTKIAAVYRNYGDMPAVVDKVIMPQILSVSRLKGSAYKAIDFIVGSDREKFQGDLTKTLADVLDSKNITIHDAFIRHVNVPENILIPLQQASVAIEQNLTNIERQKTEQKRAELNTKTQLIAQASAEVAQETEKMKAEIEAQKKKTVAEIEAVMTKQIASIDRETAEVQAQTEMILGRATAQAREMTQGELAKGFTMKVAAIGGAEALSMSTFARELPADIEVKIIHAGEGTLWTDPKIFSTGEAALLNKK